MCIRDRLFVVDSAPSRPNRTCRKKPSATATTTRSSSSTVQYLAPDGNLTGNARILRSSRSHGGPVNNYQPRAPHPGRPAVKPQQHDVQATLCNTQLTPGEGMRIGEVLGLRICDFVMGRGGTPYVEVAPRPDNANGARVKMMRPRRVYVGSDLERLFADYLTHLSCRASEWGVAVRADSALLVNRQRPPLLAPLRQGTVRDKTAALQRMGIGPPRVDRALVPAQPCDRPAVGRNGGVGGLSTVGSRPRADHVGHLRLGARGRGAARGGELEVLRGRGRVSSPV